MEHRRLSVFSPEMGRHETVRTTIEKEPGDTLERRARAFARGRYPLTEQGQFLRAQVEQALKDNNQKAIAELGRELPTVENPRLELFEDLELTTEQQEKIFGRKLANIQVTKGCRHKCTFCAAGAAEKVEMMPFAAVLKIAEKKREWDRRAREAWDAWAHLIKEKTNFDLNNWSGSFPEEVAKVCRREIKTHPVREFMIKERMSDFPTDFHFGIREPIENYYDSDPFDYRDGSFQHEDGTPADYGDVFAALASDARPIHITTAGWPEADKIAAHAAEKIVAMVESDIESDDTLAFMPRISVNKYEATARRDLDRYRSDMQKVLRVFSRVHTSGWRPQIMIFYDESDPADSEFIQKVAEPLREYAKGFGEAFIVHAGMGTSRYSGPMADEKYEDDHHDVMACMPGYHIWPDGTIARQSDEKWQPDKLNPGSKSKLVPKGSRPTPTGQKLYKL